MNIFNRGIMILLILALLILIPLFLIFPSDTFTYAKAWTTFIQGRFDFLVYLVTIVFGALIWIFLLLLLVAEVLPRRKKTIKVQMVEGGEARLHVDSIVQRLRYEVDRLPEITDVRPQVQSKGGKGINVTLDVKTTPTVNIPNKTEELVALVREQVENRMGIRLNKVAVNIKHSPYARPQRPQQPQHPQKVV